MLKYIICMANQLQKCMFIDSILLWLFYWSFHCKIYHYILKQTIPEIIYASKLSFGCEVNLDILGKPRLLERVLIVFVTDTYYFFTLTSLTLEKLVLLMLVLNLPPTYKPIQVSLSKYRQLSVLPEFFETQNLGENSKNKSRNQFERLIFSRDRDIYYSKC